MALVKGTNSYVTLIEANDYFLDRLDVEAWTQASDPLKEQALVTATGVLDEMTWTGSAITDTQSLAFPRLGSYFDPRLGMSIYLDEDFIPDRITKATMELAYHFLNNDGILDDTGRVEDLSVGSINLTSIYAPSLIPSNVKKSIKPLLLNQGSSAWWRAN